MGCWADFGGRARLFLTVAQKLWTFRRSLLRQRTRLIIVSRRHPRLYAFAKAIHVHAILDRRHRERRRPSTGVPRAIDRRSRDRRSSTINDELRLLGWAEVR